MKERRPRVYGISVYRRNLIIAKPKSKCGAGNDWMTYGEVPRDKWD